MKYSMKITDIIVNPDNCDQYDCNDYRNKEMLNIHYQLNEFLDQFSIRTDMGGLYATFLNKLGFDYQTENGWWSKIAVDRRNIVSFLKWWHNEHYSDKVDMLMDIIRQLSKKSKCKIEYINTVDKLLDITEQLQQTLLEEKLENMTT